MRILISNDDGYSAPGIDALAQAVKSHGEITVIAPESDRSGASNSLTLDRPLFLKNARNGYSYVNGTPTDCVHLAITGMLSFRPDIVISGINDGANMGEDTIYSGTVAAAMEGYMLGLPGIAFSLVKKGYEHLDSAAKMAGELVARLAPFLIAQPMLLNVNMPNLPYERIKGIKVTRLGRRHKAEQTLKAKNPRGDTVYWIGPAGPLKDAGPGTDFHAVEAGWVSITPLDADLTSENELKQVQTWID